MQVADTKISLREIYVFGDADGDEAVKAPEGASAPASAPDNMTPGPGSADVVTISSGLKSVMELPVSTGIEAPSVPGPQPGMPCVDIKALISMLKEKPLKVERYFVRVSARDTVNYLEPKDAEVVSISNGLKSFLKSVLLSASTEPLQIDIPKGASMNCFLMTVLNEALPDQRVKLFKVYRRKNGGPDRKDVMYVEEELQESEAPEADDNCVNYDPFSRYNPRYVKLMSKGRIRTSDKQLFRFKLALNITSENSGATSHDGIGLAPLIINYGGSSDELVEDIRFSFDIDRGEVTESSRFAGPGVGRLMITLIKIGIAEDGGIIYGLRDGESAVFVPDAANPA